MSLGLTYTALKPGPFEETSPFDNPFGVDAAILGPINAVATSLYIAALLGALLSLMVRFVRSRGEERQQIKWFVAVALFGFSSLVGIPIVYSLLPKGNSLGAFEDFLGTLLWTIVPASLPIAVGIAILRYRLYDIDVLINRTLVYGLLTVSLAVMYVGSVFSLQYVLRTMTGETSQLVVVASTLAIAALFNPLRRRFQSFIDRRFYRNKYDAQKTLEAFGARLRDETDLEALGDDLVGVVRNTVQPAHVSLWLKSSERGPGDRNGST